MLGMVNLETDLGKCIYQVKKYVFSQVHENQGHNNIFGRTSPALASILRSTMESALVGPMFTTAIRIPRSRAWVTNLEGLIVIS